MRAEQIGYVAGALMGTGLITWLILWPLRKLMKPSVAVIIASLACLLLACTVYDRGFAAGLTIYGLPQAIWLVILLIVEHRRAIGSPTARSMREDERVEPRFNGETWLQTDASPDSVDQRPAEYRDSASPENGSPPALYDVPMPPKKTWNVISNHWRGLYSLGVAYWVFGFLIVMVSGFGVAAIQAAFATDDGYQPVPIFLALSCTWILLAGLTAWQFIGVWRSANRTILERRVLGEKAPWAGAAKLMIFVGALRTAAVFATSAAPQLEETYRMGFLGDPSIPEYSLRIMRNGTEAEITGGFKYGLTDDFKKLLRASPQIAAVHLDSVGGRVGEAIKLNKVIRDARLKTYVANFCASACTVAFAGGTERWLYQSGTLGFHGAAFPGLDQARLNAASDGQRGAMVKSGYAQDFVAKALAVPSKDLWTPTIPELQAANVITALSNGTQFAASGFGGNVQEQTFEEPLSKNVPILSALRTKDINGFSAVVHAYYLGYTQGKTEDEIDNIIRFSSYAFVRKYLPQADDQAIIQFGALLADELASLQSRDVVQCAAFGSKAGADPDLQYSFAAPTMARFQAIGARVIQTSSRRVPDDGGLVRALFKETVSSASTSLSQRQLGLLGVGNPNVQQAPDYCAAILGLYRQMLKAPPAAAASMLRSLLSAG